MESARPKINLPERETKESRVILAYKIREHFGIEAFELYEYNEGEKIESNKFKLIGQIINPHEQQFKNYHGGDKVERLIEQVFKQYSVKKPSFLYSAYPMINGEVMLGDNIAIKNFFDL